MKKLLPLLLLSLGLAGCATQGVPRTEFTFDPATGKISYAGPKQVSLDGLKTVWDQKTGHIEVTLQHLSATNEADVISTAGNADALRINATAGLVQAVGATIAQGVGTAAKAAAVP